jgi:hypothetical protein
LISSLFRAFHTRTHKNIQNPQTRQETGPFDRGDLHEIKFTPFALMTTFRSWFNTSKRDTTIPRSGFERDLVASKMVILTVMYHLDERAETSATHRHPENQGSPPWADNTAHTHAS